MDSRRPAPEQRPNPEAAYEQLAEEVLNPNRAMEEGISSVARMVCQASESLALFEQLPLKAAADGLSKAATCHKLEKRMGHGLPTWSILHCVDVNGGGRFAPAAARGLFELEKAGNPLVEKVLERKDVILAKEGDVPAQEHFGRIRNYLESLRQATA